MSRVYNFSAGPAALPEAVLRRAADEMLDFNGAGMSVMEMSHRSKVYENIIERAESLLRELMDIPKNYRVLFLQGGASSQFSMIPLNFKKSGRADYVDTGMWSGRAIDEGKKFLDVNVVASSKDKTFNYIPNLDSSTFSKEADYFHITLNNTIFGTKYDKLPETGDVPLIADVSSCILSEKIDVTKFGMLYAGAQKNIGPSGLCVAIIREDLITDVPSCVPTMFSYKIHADNGSMYNTPPTYGIYMAMLVFEWLSDMGGVAAIEKINREKAALLYGFLDSGAPFTATVADPFRSLMNVPFLLPTDELNKQFIKEAEASGFVNLAGHRSVGGMRASIYNAMTKDGVQALLDFMKNFGDKNC